MNKYQMAFQGMVNSVSAFNDANPTITSTLVNYPANILLLKTYIPQIQACSESLNTNRSGITINKNMYKDLLINLISDIACKLSGYYLFTNNQVSMAEVNYTKSQFQRFSNYPLRDHAQIIYNKIQPIVASLTAYGITAATQTTLLTAITNFNSSIVTSRMGVATRKQSNETFKNVKALCQTVLVNMDMAVKMIKLTQPNFYNGYFSVRKIVGTKGTSMMLKINVTDLETNVPIKGVTITFSPSAPENTEVSLKSAIESSTVVLTKKTAAKGNTLEKTIKSGMYIVTASKPGFVTEYKTMAIADNELNKLYIKLVKI